MQRIIIVGTTGSGKSTLARATSQRLDLPVYDLDDLYWLPNWQPRAEQEFKTLVSNVVAQPRWIVTGNYTLVREIVWARGDGLIWIDYGCFRTFWQLLRRCVSNIRHKTVVCNGNQETLRLLLSRKSILVWFVKTYRRNRQRYGTFFQNPATYKQLELVRLTTPEETTQFLRTLRA